jgi:thioredoxin 1
MKNGAKIAIVILLALAVAATFALRRGKRAEYAAVPAQTTAVAPADQGAAVQPAAPGTAPVPAPLGANAPVDTAGSSAPRGAATAARPRLIELGSMRCQACLEMAKVLDALRASQGERLRVDFIDVFEQPDAPERYKISLIPTQILYDGGGKEIFRHTGYFSHDDILAKFGELGVKL